ncbi:MAG: S-adenosylmethionine:tRNA ribosyltransferase-isomerase, partial [Bacteroidales bacterium]|nr:S-adenosylmethionine:tRNA ribosyltransferase-isomerase [Bacteroidales bacterium]
TLESLYWYGVKLMENSSATFSIGQWYPYENKSPHLPSKQEALDIIINKLDKEQKENIRGETQLIIAPGYDYKMVDAMFTNFHLPKSTLLLLVAAYLGDDWRRVYDYALQNNFRLLSYGDSCLLIK